MRQVMRRDPAPSRLNYRISRLMLTPGFRRFLRVGLPLALIAALAGSWAAQERNRAAVREAAAALREQIETRPEFMVSRLDVQGGDAALAAEVRRVLAVSFPVSSFDLDLRAMQGRLAALDRVETASLRVRSGGVLEVQLAERVPAAIWRARDGLKLIDAGGVFVAPLDARSARFDLPLVAGDGAPGALGEARALLEAAAPIAEDLRALQRIGERRWDLVLTDARRIMLPSADPVPALERVLAIDAARDIFDRDIAVVDMRNPARPTIRMGGAAAAAFRRTSAAPAEARDGTR